MMASATDFPFLTNVIPKKYNSSREYDVLLKKDTIHLCMMQYGLYRVLRTR